MRAAASESPDRSQPKSDGMSPQSRGVPSGAADAFQGRIKRRSTPRKRAMAPGSPARSQPRSREVSGVAQGSADLSPDGEKQASAPEEQHAPLKSPGRPITKSAAKRAVALAKAGASAAAAQDVEQSANPARATKRGRAVTAQVSAGPPSPQPSAEGPLPKRATAAKSSKAAEKASVGASQPKRTARSTAAIVDAGTGVTAAATSTSQGPSADQAEMTTRKANAKKPPSKGQANSPSLSGANQGPIADKAGKQTRKTNTKKLPKKGRTNSVSQSAGQEAKKKVAAKAHPGQKRAQRKQKAKDDEVSSNASDSSYKVPRGLLQRAKRKERFEDYIWPSQDDDSDSDSEDISNVSISSIIPPAGILQPYRPKKRRLMDDSGDSSSDDEAGYDDMDVSPGEDLLSRCEALFGNDALPNSTTTRAEAVSMLVSFASNRQLRWGALAELVTIVNKLFAPAKNVLPGRKLLAKVLSQMP